MNRKLVNGLLLLSIATVGCGTFTSCKDTDDDVQAGYNKELASMYDDLIKRINDIETCDCDPNLKANLDAIATWLGATNNDGKWTLPAGGLDQAIANKIDAVFINKLNDALGTNDLKSIMPAIAQLQAEMNKMMTSIEINQTYNPVFGTLNLPTGLQTNVIAGYYGVADHAFKFPDFSEDMMDVESGVSADEAPEYVKIWKAANLTPKDNSTVNIPAGIYMDEDKDGNGLLGNAYLTINPVNVTFLGGMKLIKSNGEIAPVNIIAAPSKDELTFGYTRAEFVKNGLYKAAVTINPTQENLNQIAIALKPEFKSAVKDILKNPGKATLTQLGGALVDQINGILPAYGFYAPWEASGIYNDAEGNETTLPATSNAIVSKYEIAATAIHPLGYNSFRDLTISKRLPTFDPLTEVIHNLFADVKKQINFTLDIDRVKDLDVKFTIEKFEVKNQELVIEIPAIAIDGQTDSFTKPITIHLTYDQGTGQVIKIPEGEYGEEGALNGLIGSIVDNVNKLLIGDGVADSEATKKSIQYQVQNNILNQVNSMIADINDMLVGNPETGKPGISGQINNQLGQIIDNIENQLVGKLSSAQKLLDIYNKLAEKVNAYLADPHGHMQVAMAYEDGNGVPHMLSTNKNIPSYFSAKGGDAIQLFATSYTGDIVTPSYKKYVAVVESSNNDIAAVNAASKYLNKVISGRQHIVDMTGFKKGNYTILYTSVDYRGNTSSRLYYLTVGD